jgi:2-desacetyl-2-hydroxyethyl bacteriochlorophyllide A dehydrogenase
MKAVVVTAPNRLEMLDWPLPEPGPGQVRIRTQAFGICTTDFNIINGYERTTFPAIPGHEWSGIVDAVGPDGDQALVGKRCVGENLLSSGGEVGFEYPGGYAQYFLTEAANLHWLPADIPFDVATLTEPLAVALRARKQARDDASEPMLIVGDGPIGLLLVLVLKCAGTKNIVMVGGREHRLALAAEFGATHVLNYHRLEGNLSTSIRQALGREFPTIFEASGNGSALDACLNLTPPGGRILVVGEYGEARASFLWNQVLLRELELIGSCASMGVWPEAIRLAALETHRLQQVITHRLPAERFNDAIDIARHERCMTKVVLEWS